MAGATRPALISVSGVGAMAFDWTLKRTALARVACGGQQRTVSGGHLSALRPNRRTLNANLPSVRYETLQPYPHSALRQCRCFASCHYLVFYIVSRHRPAIERRDQTARRVHNLPRTTQCAECNTQLSVE